MGSIRGVLGWLAVAGLVIGLTAGPSPTNRAWTGIPEFDLTTLMAIVFVVFAPLALALLVFVIITTRTGDKFVGPPDRTLRQLAAMVLLLGLLMLFGFDRDRSTSDDSARSSGVNADVAAPAEGPRGVGTEDATPLLGVAIVAAAVLLWLRRSGSEPEPATVENAIDADIDATGLDHRDPFDLSPAVGRAADQLLTTGGPRGAVLRAYRELEVELEAIGLDRQVSETPTEHLARSMVALDIDDPVTARPLLELAGLYARARFSDHAITVGEQQRAGQALAGCHEALAERGPSRGSASTLGPAS